MVGESARFGTSSISLFIQNYKDYSRMDDIMCVCVCACVLCFQKCHLDKTKSELLSKSCDISHKARRRTLV